MSSTKCFCPDAGKANLGITSCPSILGTVKKHILMDKIDSDGIRNGIPVASLVDDGNGNFRIPDSYMLGRINESDVTKRFYFTPDAYQFVTEARTEEKTEEAPSGTIYKLEDGVPTFEGAIVGADTRLASRFGSAGCSSTAVYEVGVKGGIKGELSADGLWYYPMEINKGSFSAVPVPAVEGSSVSRIVVKFQYSQLIDESRLSVMNSSLIETDLLQVNGLLDGLTSVWSSPAISATTVSIAVPYNFATFGNPSYIQGLDVALDWELLDGVTPVAISGVVDTNTDGSQYDFTFTSTPTTVLKLNYVGVPASSTDQGFDIRSVTFTTPA